MAALEFIVLTGVGVAALITIIWAGLR